MTSTEVGWNVGLELGQAQKCGGVKDVNALNNAADNITIWHRT
jgi:hypothetical protein